MTARANSGSKTERTKSMLFHATYILETYKSQRRRIDEDIRDLETRIEKYKERLGIVDMPAEIQHHPV